jgi:myo-inositol 2-dehydrogenase / D-chiro-inositol 1-dehydrogenase
MLRIAVLGAGRIGKIHAASAAAHPGASLVAVADPFGSAASELAAALGAEAMADPKVAIERNDVDAVVVGTPTDTHVDLVLHAVRHGKAVLCEKPLDLDLGRADAAVAEIERSGGRVMLAFNRRFDPAAIELKQAAAAGEIGELRQVVITSRDPGLAPRGYIATSGGIFRDMTIHDFDMARFFLGEEPTEVMAIGSATVDKPLMDEFEDYDTVMVQMRTASGKQCHINCCRAAVYGYDQRFELFGSAGMLQNDNVRPTSVRRWTADATDAAQPLLNFFLERYAGAYCAELDAFVRAVADGNPMPVTARDGRQALRLADCALESARTGRLVRV